MTIDNYTPDIAIGDSIAWGLINRTHVGIEGQARIGAQPKEVLGYIQNTDPSQLRGKSIVLSSGLSNNPAEFALVEQEVDLLTKAGAHVSLLGVSNENEKLSRYNPELQAIAERHGAVFVTLPSTASDSMKIHPPSGALLANVINANAGRGGGAPLQNGIPYIANQNTQPVQEGSHASHTNRHPKFAAQDGLTAEATRQVQELLKGKYNLGAYGDAHDGVDAVDGKLTHFAFNDEKKHLIDAGLLKKEADVNAVLAAIKQDVGSPESPHDTRPDTTPHDRSRQQPKSHTPA